MTQLQLRTTLLAAGFLAACNASVIRPTSEEPSNVIPHASPDESAASAADDGKGEAKPDGAPAATTPTSAPTTAAAPTAAASASSAAGSGEAPPAIDTSAPAGQKWRNDANMAGQVKAARPKILWCLKQARKSEPGLKGALTVHIEMDVEGKVTAASIVDEGKNKSEIKNQYVRDCAVDTVKTIRFLPSEKGKETTLNYPFGF